MHDLLAPKTSFNTKPNQLPMRDKHPRGAMDVMTAPFPAPKSARDYFHIPRICVVCATFDVGLQVASGASLTYSPLRSFDFLGTVESS